MLKMKLDKASFDILSDTVKEQYKANADSTEWTLDLDGYEDPAELRRARDREKQAAKDEKKRADDLQATIDAKDETNLKRRGDVDSLEKSYNDKIDKLKKESDEKLSVRAKQIEKLLIDNKASELANRISLAPNLMLPLIKARLSVDFDGDEPLTRVLGTDGKLSALTIDDLGKEFVDNKEFAPIIRGSNASGGGAAGNPSSGGAAKAFKDMGDVERSAMYKSDPVRFKRESDALRASQHQT